jgi:hypothetical protein
MLDPSFFLQHSKEPKVARTQIWRISSVGKEFKLRIRDFFGNLLTMVAYGIVILDEKLSCPIAAPISHLLIHKVGENILYEAFLGACLITW